LGLLGEADVLPLVQRAVRVENEAYRRAAALVLARTGTDSAFAALGDAVRSEDNVEVVQHLLRLLGETKSKRALHVFVDVLTSPGEDHWRHGWPDSVRQEARAQLLAAVGPAEAADLLRAAA